MRASSDGERTLRAEDGSAWSPAESTKRRQAPRKPRAVRTGQSANCQLLRRGQCAHPQDCGRMVRNTDRGRSPRCRGRPYEWRVTHSRSSSISCGRPRNSTVPQIGDNTAGGSQDESAYSCRFHGWDNLGSKVEERDNPSHHSWTHGSTICSRTTISRNCARRGWWRTPIWRVSSRR
jgi:hypothetical protein